MFFLFEKSRQVEKDKKLSAFQTKPFWKCIWYSSAFYLVYEMDSKSLILITDCSHPHDAPWIRPCKFLQKLLSWDVPNVLLPLFKFPFLEENGFFKKIPVYIDILHYTVSVIFGFVFSSRTLWTKVRLHLELLVQNKLKTSVWRRKGEGRMRFAVCFLSDV